MKIEVSIEIDKPQEIVAELFANPDLLGKYQDGFIKKELLDGTAAENGAVSKMYYKQGKRDMIITETITNNNLPQSFEAFYHHEHMDNTMKCTFTAVDENKTIYLSEVEYTRVSWIMPKLMFILFPGMFRKQIEKWMHQFKAFAEKQNAPTS